MIPEFRLPEKVLDQELQPLWKAGARFVGQSKFAGQESPDGLLDAGFDAVIVSTGQEQTAQPPAGQTPPKGKASPAAAPPSAGDLLRAVRIGDSVKLSSSVLVVGAGTTALDAARTALRLGAADVTVATSHDATSIPAGERHLKAATEEGVNFEFGVDETKSAALAAKGATVIHAIVPEGGERPAANRYTGRTAVDGVFVAAEDIAGSRSAIHAVAAGKRAALAADAWLRGQDLAALEKDMATYAALPYLDQLQKGPSLGVLGKRLAERKPVWLKMGVNAEPAARSVMPVVPVARRLKGPKVEVEQGLTPAAAQEEAKRCMQCVCPSLGECDLQRLGVEHGITGNPLVTKTGRVRAVEPQYGHPFIRRSMDRCISCGLCVHVCRELAGPACYAFTGRGFTINVDTPYSDSLQLAECTSCGRCVTACPTGALTFNQRRLDSFRVDESRCILCRECVEVCPVDALEETNHFEEARRKWLELVGQESGLAGGHRLCAGCGAPVVVRQVLMGTSDPVVVGASTGCLEVSTTIYPYTSWRGGYIHTAFENVAATLSGVETAFRALKKKGAIDENVKFIAFGGDGGTYDIGLQSLSGAMERGHRMLYVCYDNGAYMNTGFQRSGATPVSAWTTTSPVGKESPGKVQNRKDLTELMIAHGLPYVAQASPHDPRDLVRKAAKALSVDGPTFLNVLSPCPRGWRSDGAESIDLAREAVNTCYWPLFEYEDGVYRLTYRPHHKLPLVPWLKRQGRFAHLFKPGFEDALASIETWVDAEWDKLLRKCGEPSETDWQAHLQQDGCVLR
jgi:pyruvate ferredoxin oxidoreductase beta subunit